MFSFHVGYNSARGYTNYVSLKMYSRSYKRHLLKQNEGPGNLGNDETYKYRHRLCGMCNYCHVEFYVNVLELYV